MVVDGKKMEFFLFATGVKFALFGKSVCNNYNAILSIIGGNLPFYECEFIKG